MRFSAHSFSTLMLAGILVVANSFGERAAGDEPQLSFDFGRAIECRDVTPPAFLETHPDERVIDCTLRLSVNLAEGSIGDVASIRVEMTDADRRLRVVGFSPCTKLESEFAEDLETTKTKESANTFTASLGGELPAPLGNVVAHVTPTLGGTKGGKETVTEKVVRVAPKHAVVASGTMNEEHGVFFTLRPSPTTSLEGVHELSVQFMVPANWRGDAIRVSCQATGSQKVWWVKQPKVWAQKTSPVALYLAGDTAARRAAERLVRQ
jgi:hypothetical protein